MKNIVLGELSKAESLLSNWKWLPGSQVKVLIAHLIKSLDFVASYMLSEETMLERSYLDLACFKLFNDPVVESSLYDNYFYLKNLIRKDIQRVNPETVKVVGLKQSFTADRAHFESIISDIRAIVSNAFD